MPGFGRQSRYDAVVVGAGPNGLSAAIVLARAGLSTLVIEAHATPGGGARTAQLTLDGFSHDVCSTVHPLGIASPFFRALQLERYGVSWCQPPLALAHVLHDGSAVTLAQSVSETARGLGPDEQAYLELMSPFVERAPELLIEVLGPLRVPRSPLLLAKFGLVALGSLEGLARRRFQSGPARALLAGMGAHAMQSGWTHPPPRRLRWYWRSRDTRQIGRSRVVARKPLRARWSDASSSTEVSW